MLLLPVKQQLFNRTGGGLVHMGCEILVPLITVELPPIIDLFSHWSIGQQTAIIATTPSTTTAWTVANRANLYPITIQSKYTVRFFRWRSGGATAGNYDVGLYDKNLSLLRSLGSTPFPALNTLVEDAITPLSLQPGTYWLAFVCDGVVAQLRSAVPNSNSDMLVLGVRAMDAAFPLPAVFIHNTSPNALIPLLGIAREGN